MTEDGVCVWGGGGGGGKGGGSCHTKNQLMPKPFTEKTSKSAK